MTEVTEEVLEEETVEEPAGEVEEPKEADNTTELLEAMKKEVSERIRKEEKDKLYPTIKKYKDDLKEKEEALKSLHDKIKQYEDSNLSNEEKVQKQLKELEEANTKLYSQLESVSEIAAKEIYAVKLEAAREKVLAKYGDSIIPEMISGSTIEEINESAERANSVYLNIKAKAEEDAKLASRKVKVGTDVSPKSTSMANSTDMDIQDIKNISDPKEWEKVKAQLKAKAFQIR
jgi:hypothetical protein